MYFNYIIHINVFKPFNLFVKNYKFFMIEIIMKKICGQWGSNPRIIDNRS